MRLTRAASFLLLGAALLAPAQSQQYVISTYAGGALRHRRQHLASTRRSGMPVPLQLTTRATCTL